MQNTKEYQINIAHYFIVTVWDSVEYLLFIKVAFWMGEVPFKRL